jgi:hypothetical protein
LSAVRCIDENLLKKITDHHSDASMHRCIAQKKPQKLKDLTIFIEQLGAKGLPYIYFFGKRGIRTPGARKDTPIFKIGAMNRSAIFPLLRAKRT